MYTNDIYMYNNSTDNFRALRGITPTYPSYHIVMDFYVSGFDTVE